jgi:hypothetical protein
MREGEEDEGAVQKGRERRPCIANMDGAGRSAFWGVVVMRRPDSTTVAEGGSGGLTEEKKRQWRMLFVWVARKARRAVVAVVVANTDIFSVRERVGGWVGGCFVFVRMGGAKKIISFQ